MSNSYLVNLIPDPRCTSAASASAIGGASISVDTDWSASGDSGSYHVTGTAAGYGLGWTVALSQPGDTMTFALYLRAGAAAVTGASLHVAFSDGQSFALAAGDLSAWGLAREVFTLPVPTDASTATVSLTAGAAGEFWVDDIVVAFTDADPGRLDGDLPKVINADGTSYVYVWQGARDATPSVRYTMSEILPAPTPTGAGPQPTQNPAALESRWVSTFTVADAFNPNGIVLDGVTAASLSHDWFSATKGSLSATVLRHPNLSGYLIDWPTASIIPNRVDAAGKAHPLGIYVVTGVDETVGADGSYSINVSASDRTVLLSSNVWMDSTGTPVTASFASGTNLVSIINQILACAAIPPISTADDATNAATINNDFTYPTGTDLLTMANDLLQNTGFRALTVKNDGTFYIAPATSLSLRTTPWTHSGAMTDGEGSKRAPGFGMTRDLFGVPNKVVCVSAQFGDSSLGLNFVGVAEDRDPASPFSYLPNPDPSQPPIRGWKVKVYQDIAADTQEAIDKMAKQYLAQLQGQSRTATVQHLFMDGFDTGSTVLFSDTTSGRATGDTTETPDSFLAIVSSQSIDLIGMGLTSSTLLEITSGVTDWNDGSTANLGSGDTSDQYIVTS